MKEAQTIILAGGNSRRMGSDKGLLKRSGKPFVLKVIEAAKPVSNRVMIITSNDEYKRFGQPLHDDLIKNKGPVGGIYTGLSISKYETNIILSCDIPYIEASLISVLLSRSGNEDVLIYKDGDKTHPLIGIYKKSVSEHFKKCIDKNVLKMEDALKSLNVKELDLPEPMRKQAQNINTKQEFEELR